MQEAADKSKRPSQRERERERERKRERERARGREWASIDRLTHRLWSPAPAFVRHVTGRQRVRDSNSSFHVLLDSPYPVVRVLSIFSSSLHVPTQAPP